MIRWANSYSCFYISHELLNRLASAMLTIENKMAVYFYWDFAMVLLEMFICTFIGFSTQMTQRVLDRVAVLNRKNAFISFILFIVLWKWEGESAKM